MPVSRFGVAVLIAAALAGCVRNPLPAGPEASPSGGGGDPLAVLSDAPARLGSSVDPVSRPWESYRAAPRSVGGVERVGAPLPRQWRGLVVAEPARCDAFDPVDYAAGALPVPRLRDEGGRFREPLGCSLFGAGDPMARAGRVVSAAAAHDAGLCARPAARTAFAVDPDNRVYLPAVVAAARDEVVARGDGEWLPGRNLCWYVGTQLRVRRRHGLSVSAWEARLFEAVLRGCPAVAPVPTCDVRDAGPW